MWSLRHYPRVGIGRGNRLGTENLQKNWNSLVLDIEMEMVIPKILSEEKGCVTPVFQNLSFLVHPHLLGRWDKENLAWDKEIADTAETYRY